MTLRDGILHASECKSSRQVNHLFVHFRVCCGQYLFAAISWWLRLAVRTILFQIPDLTAALFAFDRAYRFGDVSHDVRSIQ